MTITAVKTAAICIFFMKYCTLRQTKPPLCKFFAQLMYIMSVKTAVLLKTSAAVIFNAYCGSFKDFNTGEHFDIQEQSNTDTRSARCFNKFLGYI